MTAGTTTYPEWDKRVVDWDEKPEPAAIWQIIGGYSLYWALVAAVKLRVFDQLTEGPVGLDELADGLGVDAGRLGVICDALVGVWILDGDRAGYRLNKTSGSLLVTSSDRYMGDVVVESPGIIDNWPALADTTLTGEPPYDVDDDGGAFYTRFARAGFLTQLRSARFAAARLGFSQDTEWRILDLGAGGGPWTVAFLEASPRSTAVVNELPAVVPVAEEMCDRFGVADRCVFLAGDYHTVDVEHEGFDLVVLGHLLRNEGPDGAGRLLGRAFGALRPGGRIVVADYFVADDHRGPPQALLLGVTMVANTRTGSVYRHRDISRWLTEAGYSKIRTLETVKNTHVLVAEKGRP